MAPVESVQLEESPQPAAGLVFELPSGDGLAALYGAIASDGSAARVRRETAALFSVAEGCLLRGDVEDAMQLALEALEAARAQGDPTTEADILRLVLHCFRFRGQRSFAMQMAEEELGGFSDTGDALGQAKMLLAMAEIGTDLRGQEHCNKALRSAQDALRIFRDQGQQNLEAMALLTLVKLYLTSKDGNTKDFVKRAERAAKEAANLSEELHDRRGLARALHCLGAACAQDRRPDRALQASATALAIFRELGDQRMEAFELQSAAEWRLLCNDPWGAALPSAEQALAIFRRLRWGAAWEASALRTVARVLCARQETAKALALLKDGLQRLRLEGDKAAEAQALSALVDTYAANGDFTGALRTAERSRSAYKNMGNKQMESLMLRTVSRLQISQWEPGPALRTAEEALALGQEADSAKDKADALLLLARVKLANELYPEALEAAEEARQSFEQQADRAGEGVSLITSAMIHSYQNDHDAAGAELMQAYVIFRDAGDEAGEARALTQLCEVQIARGVWDKALSAAERARALLEELGDRPGEITVLLYAAQVSLKQFVDTDGDDYESLEECRLQALSAAGEAVSLCREDEEQHRDLLARSLFMLAQAELVDSRPRDVRQDAAEALALFEQAGDISSQAACLDVMSRAFFMTGSAEEAEEAALRAHSLFQSIGDEQGEAQIVTLLEQLGSRRFAKQEVVSAQARAEPSAELAGPSEADAPEHAPREAARTINLDNVAKLDTSGGVSVPMLRNWLRDLMGEFTGDEEIEYDVGLMSAGLTSATATSFGTAIQMDFPTVPMPMTLIFDYPSIDAVANFLVEKIPKK